MKSTFRKIFIAVAVLLGLASYGQNQKSLLWKISGNGLKTPSYLYGTIHITCDASLEKPTLDALDKTSQLYLELDMDDAEMQLKMMGGMMMKDGKRMSKMVSAEDFKLLNDYLIEKTGITVTLFDTMKPMLVSTMLLPSIMECPTQSVEESLMRVTKEQKEEVYGLETIEDQMGVFDGIPDEVQMDELMKSVKDKFVRDKKELTEMYAVYKSKDIDAMHEMTMTSENKTTADYQDVLLNNRNANWIPKIESIAKENPTFFAVGAAHLGGDKGVIALLRKKGYKVEAVF
jgi:uncharacterized protein YbaP (TraB family)